MASTFILPALPPALRSLDDYFNIANKYHSTDSSITYWSKAWILENCVSEMSTELFSYYRYIVCCSERNNASKKQRGHGFS